MELRNTLKNMFLNSLQADLLCVAEKITNLDFNSLGFDEVQAKKLETLSNEMIDWVKVIMTYKGGLKCQK